MARPVRSFIFLAVLLTALPVRAETDGAALDQLVADTVKAFEVPGAAIAVVKDDQIVYLKGFGVRKKGDPDPVTPDTVFAIASCSKAFTAAGIAMLVADGKMSWDDPVRKHLDWFRLADTVADREVTIRDLLCHRTGMPRHDMLWSATEMTAEEYVRAYGKAKPATSFRSTWEYANVPFTTAGLAAGKASGTDWPTLIRSRIFEPLGMKSAYCSAREAQANPDHATPHNRHADATIGPVVRADVDSVRAAGSINASARAMTAWLRFHLADGELDKKRLIPAGTLLETRTAQVVVRREGRWKNFYPDRATRHLAYGLGWFVHDYRGQFAVSHGGTLDGFRAQTVLLPDRKLGVVVLGNLTPSSFPEALTKLVIDRLLDLPKEDWTGFYREIDRKNERTRLADQKKRETDRKKDTRPSLDRAAYAGTYEEPAYGKAEVANETDGLKFRWGRLTWKLEHHHFDTFIGTVVGPTRDDAIRFREKPEVQFRLSAKGDVEGVRFLDQEFKKSKSNGTRAFALRLRSRPEKDGKHSVATREQSWPAARTAVIVCDMWDAHHCLNAVRREDEMVPRMNEFLTKARTQGALIIHAPSSCMEPYRDHPARKRAQAAPAAKTLPADIDKWCHRIPAEEKGTYPIDQSDGGEDDDPKEHEEWHAKLKQMGRNPKAPWKSQHAGLTIRDEDAISDSGIEIWNLLESRGIDRVLLVGVHTNMCVLGRPFGLRQLARNGKNVVLVRDLTDTMYNPKRPPHVSHFEGTRLIVEHIEKYVCPTITSDQVIGGKEFRFQGDQ